MLKKISLFLFTGFMAVNICGCIMVAAELQEAAKASQTLDISYGDAIDAVKCAFKDLNVEFEKAVLDPDAARAKGKYTDGRTAHVEIFKVGAGQCKIDVRVGTSEAGKKDAQEIIDAIAKCASSGR